MDSALDLRCLLEYLDGEPGPHDGHWSDWQIRRIFGGRNNLLYRAAGPGADLAIKFTCADTWDRAGREYSALALLRQAGLDVAPEPVLLDCTSYRQPVVQTWLPGDVGLVPRTDDHWDGVVRHLAHVHSITPLVTDAQLPPCTIDARSPEQGKERVREQLALLPEEAQPERLCALVEGLEAIEFPGTDRRLAAWPEGWRADIEAKYRYYLAVA
ncbi:MAG: hypothetical protein ACP5JJ_12975 [Anaerolineae bacterium]